MTRTALEMFHFDNSFVRDLPGLYQWWNAEPVANPAPVVVNTALATELGLDPEMLSSPDGIRALLADPAPAGAEPVALAYAGHQFGSYSPRLGDGRALLLGEMITPDGQRLDVHLKGSGRTPFARGGDGRAVLGPMLREYLMGEAMHALGVPTTRALAVIATGEDVRRETTLPAQCWCGWRRAISGSAHSNSLRPPAISTCCVRSPPTRSHATIRRLHHRRHQLWRSSNRFSLCRRIWWLAG